MERTCFICRRGDAQEDFLTYHELPRRPSGEEFFVFISRVGAEHETPLRELFRRIISASRLGSPLRRLRALVEAAADLPGAEAGGAHLSETMILVALRRGADLFLLRNRSIEPVHFEALSGTEGTLESFPGRSEIGLSSPGRQGDLFEKNVEDQFILEKVNLEQGEHTLLLAPSREYVRRNRGALLDSVLFPAFQVPASGEIRLSADAACPGIHWKGGALPGERDHQRKRGVDMLKGSAPIVAGAAALVIAILLIFKPFGGQDRPALEQPEALLPADQAVLETVPVERRAGLGEESEALIEPAAGDKLAAAGARGAGRLALAIGWSRKMEGAVTSSPAVCAGRVIFGSRDGHLYAYSTGGNRLWKYRAADGVGASPCCAGELVVGADYQGNVFCLDASSGTRIWNYQAGARIVSSPRVEGGHVIACTRDGRVVALDIENGQRIWSQTIGEDVWATPAVGADYVVAASIDGSLVRLARDGAVLWRVAPGGTLHSSPLVIEGRGLVVIGTGDSHLAAHSLQDGAPLWKTAAGSEIRSAPVSDGSMIYVGTEDGTLLAVDMSGTEAWRRKTGGAIRSRPLILHEAILVTAYDKMLSAYSRSDGSLLGSYRADSELYSSPAYHDGRVFFGSNAGLLHAPLVTVKEG